MALFTISKVLFVGVGALLVILLFAFDAFLVEHSNINFTNICNISSPSPSSSPSSSSLISSSPASASFTSSSSLSSSSSAHSTSSSPIRNLISSRECTNTSAWYNSTCIFHQVCWSPIGEGTWYYFHESNFSDEERGPRVVVTPTYDHTYETDNNVNDIPLLRWKDVATNEFDWNKHLVLYEKRDTILSAPVFWNFGHALLDSVYAIYKIMARWGRGFAYHDRDLHIELMIYGGNFFNTDPGIYHLIHDQVPKFQLRNFPENEDQYSLLQCYDNVMIGAGQVGVQGWGHYSTSHQGNHSHFRDLVVKNLNLTVPVPDHPVLTIVSREGHVREAVNENDTIAAIQDKYKNTNVEVRVVKLEDHALRDQIRIVQETSIYLSIAGTSTHMAIFLKEGATLLDAVPDFEHEHVPYYRIYVDKFWCDNQNSILCVPFPVKVFNRTKEELKFMDSYDVRDNNVEFDISDVLARVDTALASGMNSNIYKKQFL